MSDLEKQLLVNADVKGRGETRIPISLSKKDLLVSFLTAVGLLVAQYLGYADIESVQLLLGAVSS